jgi:lipoate---protein ligase
MRFLDYTFDRPEENIACDEALLDLAIDGLGGECLRFWEPQSYFVVVGYTNEVRREVNIVECAAAGIPILRRCSGGGAVLQGPGCLNYALILNIDSDPALDTVTGSNTFILGHHAHALRPVLPAIPEQRGHTDLVLHDRKFSGNSQRRKGRHLLFHGTFLYDFELEQIARFLSPPSIAPVYRRGRPHGSFVANLSASRGELVARLRNTWNAYTDWEDIPFERIATLCRDKYLDREWTFRR